MARHDEFKVSKGIPVPPPKRGPHKTGYAAAFRRLKPGESVFLPKVDQQHASKNAFLVLGKGNYACRAEGKGARVWRLK